MNSLIQLAAGKTYRIARTVHLPAGVILDLNGATIKPATGFTGTMFQKSGTGACVLRNSKASGGIYGAPTSGFGLAVALNTTEASAGLTVENIAFYDCALEADETYPQGRGCIRIAGGDRATLTGGSHVLRGCTLDNSKVEVAGVGHEFHDLAFTNSPYNSVHVGLHPLAFNAVNLSGLNKGLFQGITIANGFSEGDATTDHGNFYVGRSLFGDLTIKDLTLSNCKARGLYLDDGAASIFVTGCTVTNQTGISLQHGGGPNVQIVNFVDTDASAASKFDDRLNPATTGFSIHDQFHEEAWTHGLSSGSGASPGTSRFLNDYSHLSGATALLNYLNSIGSDVLSWFAGEASFTVEGKSEIDYIRQGTTPEPEVEVPVGVGD